jgi:ribosome-associated toxin RatA of RatAB toxin-antitoxin module
MSEATESTIRIEAPFADVVEVVTDLAKYPEWASSIKRVEVIESDSEGRPVKAKLTVDAGPLRDTATLQYDWSLAPSQLSWTLLDAELLTAMDGAYTIAEADEDSTDVTYRLEVDVAMPMLSMLKRKAEQAVVDVALKELKKRVETA